MIVPTKTIGSACRVRTPGTWLPPKLESRVSRECERDSNRRCVVFCQCCTASTRAQQSVVPELSAVDSCVRVGSAMYAITKQLASINSNITSLLLNA